jgi:hypothetical protein
MNVQIHHFSALVVVVVDRSRNRLKCYSSDPPILGTVEVYTPPDVPDFNPYNSFFERRSAPFKLML